MIFGFIFGFLFFFLTIFVSFFIPGKFLLSSFKLKKDFPRFELNVLAWFAGVSLFLLGTYISAYLHFSYLYLIAIFALALAEIYSFIRVKKIFEFNFKIDDKWSLLLIILGSLAFSSLMFFSGFETKSGLQFVDVNAVDGIRHLAYISDQIVHFPPQQPSVAGVPLRGFHYFYDFILSRFALFYHFPVEDLYFRYFPFFISLLFGSSFVLLSNRISKEKSVRRFILFLVYFSQSGTVFLYLFNRSVNLISDGIVQPLGLIVNPFIVLSLGMLICGVSLLPFIKKSWKYGLLIGLIFGVLSEIKVHSGITAIASLLLYDLYLLIRYKRKYLVNIIITTGITGIITAITFFPNNLGSGGLVFAPLLIFRHYMEMDSGFLAPYKLELKRLAYTADNNYFGLFRLYAMVIGVFVLVNFGIRLIFLVKIKKLFLKTFWRSDINFILFWVIIIPCLLGSLFVQSVSVFDSVQFFWILTVLTCIPAGVVLAEIYKKIPYTKILVILLLLITVPGLFAMGQRYSASSSRTTVITDDVYVLKKIRTIVPTSSFLVLIPASDKVQAMNYPLPKGTPFITAISGRQVYYEEGWLPSKDEDKFKLRKVQIDDLQNAIAECSPSRISEILKKIGSPYVVTIGSYPCLVRTFKIVDKVISEKGVIAFYEFEYK